MKEVHTPYSRGSKAHYVPGMIDGGLLYISGQLSIDPATGKRPEGGLLPEARQAFANVGLVLTAAGAKPADVIQCRIYTPDVVYWDQLNAVCAEFFGEHKPARVVVPTTALHHGCLVEVEALARVAAL